MPKISHPSLLPAPTPARPLSDSPARFEVSLSLASWPGAIGAYLSLGLVFCFLGLENHGYMSMEGMVTDVATRMVESGNYWVPHLYGEMYTYKPPLAYWMAIPSVLVSDGVPATWLLRLPFALTGLAMGLGLLVLVGRRLGPLAGLCCAVASSGSVLFIEKVRIGEFDTPLATFVGLAVVFATLALADEEPRSSSWFLGYALLLLGFLSKGAPALMAFFPGLVLAALATRRPQRLLSKAHLSAFTLFVVAIASYVLLMVSLAGWDALLQPAQEAKVRGFGWTLPALLFTLSKPVQVLAAFAPFSLLLPLAIRLSKLEKNGTLSWTARAVRSGLAFFSGGLLAFVMVPTHEMRYYLPLCASLGICTGLALHDVVGMTRAPDALVKTVRCLSVLTALCVPVALLVFPSTPALVSLSILALVCIFVSWSREIDGAQIAAALVAFAVFVACSQALVFLPRRAANRDLAKVATTFSEQLPATATVWTRGSADLAGKHSSLHANLDRKVVVFGADQQLPPETAEWWIDTAAEVPASRQGFRVVASVEAWSRTYLLLERE